MFYEIVNNLCKARKISITRMAEEIGLSNAAPTSWKQGSTPKLSTLKKISDYFNVSVEYLLGNEQKKAPTVFGEREFSIKEISDAFDAAEPAIREAVLRLLKLQ